MTTHHAPVLDIVRSVSIHVCMYGLGEMATEKPGTTRSG